MFNVKVLRMKDIIKYFAGVTLTIAIVMSLTKYFTNIKTSRTEVKSNLFSTNDMLRCLDETIPAMANIRDESSTELEKLNTSTNDILEGFLKTEISSIKGLEEAEKENQEKVEEGSLVENEMTETSNNTNENQQNMELAATSNVQTEIVTENPIQENYNVQYGSVKIKNQTTYDLTDEVLNPNITIDNKNVLIFHTHTCESYTPSEKYPYESTGNYRTTDLNLTVTRVGTELETYLKKYNISVKHNTTYHDYPSYTGSYTRSLETVENELAETPADIIIDLHRDAIGSRGDYAPTVKIGNDYAAQIMFVIGTNEGGLVHPNWQQNLKFAVKIQQKAEEMYPGLFKPIMVTKSRYNQHTGKYANIIEVGATGNTLEQCLTSMKYLSSVMNMVINE